MQNEGSTLRRIITIAPRRKMAHALLQVLGTSPLNLPGHLGSIAAVL